MLMSRLRWSASAAEEGKRGVGVCAQGTRRRGLLTEGTWSNMVKAPALQVEALFKAKGHQRQGAFKEGMACGKMRCGSDAASALAPCLCRHAAA